MNNIKNIDPNKIDNTMDAIGSVLKAIVDVVKCIDSFRNKNEPIREKVV